MWLLVIFDFSHGAVVGLQSVVVAFPDHTLIQSFERLASVSNIKLQRSRQRLDVMSHQIHARYK